MSRIYYSLYDRMLSRGAIVRASAKVRRAKGAPGIDGQTTDEFHANVEDEAKRLISELREKRYCPQPVKRVTIPKPGGGERHLGIPCVRDRVVQQALLDILQSIFDPDFHPSSYGYRPKRSCQQAVAKAAMFIREYDRDWVVDMDLSKCFDRLDHELILRSVAKRVRDGSILNLIRMFLESGVMIEGRLEATGIGSPQGGVISPLISNIYLDAFDQEMKRRGHRIVRYADDILILCQSESAAHRAYAVAKAYLEGELRLLVNSEKTHIVHASNGVDFLGVSIFPSRIAIQNKKLDSLKTSIKRITRRTSPVNLEQVLQELNPILRGFASYFRMANCTSHFGKLMQWIRRRLRAKQLALWKTPERLQRRLRQVGFKGNILKMRMQHWRTSACQYASMAMTNHWFAELGLYDLKAVKTGQLPHVM